MSASLEQIRSDLKQKIKEYEDYLLGRILEFSLVEGLDECLYNTSSSRTIIPQKPSD